MSKQRVKKAPRSLQGGVDQGNGKTLQDLTPGVVGTTQSVAQAAPTETPVEPAPEQTEVVDEAQPANVDHDPKKLGVEGQGLAAAVAAINVDQPKPTPAPATPTPQPAKPYAVKKLNLLTRPDFKAGVEAAQEVISQAKEVEAFVMTVALPTMADYQDMAAPARKMRNPVTQKTFEQEYLAIRDQMDRLMKGLDGEEYVGAAYMGYYLWHFMQSLNSPDEVFLVIGGLFREGKLIEVKDEKEEADLPGGIIANGKNKGKFSTIDGRRFNFVAKAGITAKDRDRLREAYKKQLGDAWTALKAEWDQKARGLEQGGNISLGDAIIRKEEGFVCLKVAPSTSPEGENLEGGTALFRVNDEGLAALVDHVNDSRGFGRFDRSMKRMMDLRVYLSLDSLSYPTAPPFGLLKANGIGEDEARVIQAAWHVWDRACMADPETRAFLEGERAKKQAALDQKKKDRQQTTKVKKADKPTPVVETEPQDKGTETSPDQAKNTSDKPVAAA